jgi:hypothetical protein
MEKYDSSNTWLLPLFYLHRIVVGSVSLFRRHLAR